MVNKSSSSSVRLIITGQIDPEPSFTTSPADVRKYFFEAAQSGLRVKLGPHVLSPMSETCAIAAGHYEFTRTADGQKFPARYSFFLVKQNGEWMIAHQHSSLVPKPVGG